MSMHASQLINYGKNYVNRLERTAFFRDLFTISINIYIGMFSIELTNSFVGTVLTIRLSFDFYGWPNVGCLPRCLPKFNWIKASLNVDL